MVKEDLRFIASREKMIKEHLEPRGIKDPKVLAAFRRVPRQLFVSEALQDQSYSDFPLPIGEQQTISQPYIVAEMTQALQLEKDDRVLEIGTGSGYQAAILAEIVYRVYTVERIHKLLVRARKIFDKLGYHNIVTKLSDGTLGWKDQSPFDAIVVTAGSPEIPYPLVSQLAMGGRMVIPVGNQQSQELVRLFRDERGIHSSSLGACRFVKLMGEHGWKD